MKHMCPAHQCCDSFWIGIICYNVQSAPCKQPGSPMFVLTLTAGEQLDVGLLRQALREWGWHVYRRRAMPLYMASVAVLLMAMIVKWLALGS